MGVIIQEPNLRDIIKPLLDRIDRLERSVRFTVPQVATDPTNTRNGDAWINTTTNLFKVVDKNGTVRTITWV
jgi:hypothetical protein